MISCILHLGKVNVLQTHIIHDHKAHRAAQQQMHLNETLDAALIKNGYAQNENKQELAAAMKPLRGQQEILKGVQFAGRMLSHMKHLGPHYHPQGYHTHERTLRLRAMRTSWDNLGKC